MVTERSRNADITDPLSYLAQATRFLEMPFILLLKNRVERTTFIICVHRCPSVVKKIPRNVQLIENQIVIVEDA